MGEWKPVYHIFVIPYIDKLRQSLETTVVGVIKNIVMFIALTDSYTL